MHEYKSGRDITESPLPDLRPKDRSIHRRYLWRFATRDAQVRTTQDDSKHAVQKGDWISEALRIAASSRIAKFVDIVSALFSLQNVMGEYLGHQFLESRIVSHQVESRIQPDPYHPM